MHGLFQFVIVAGKTTVPLFRDPRLLFPRITLHVPLFVRKVGASVGFPNCGRCF